MSHPQDPGGLGREGEGDKGGGKKGRWAGKNPKKLVSKKAKFLNSDISNEKNINDLLVNLNPKVLRFTGEKFPSELWNTSSARTDKNIAAK